MCRAPPPPSTTPQKYMCMCIPISVSVSITKMWGSIVFSCMTQLMFFSRTSSSSVIKLNSKYEGHSPPPPDPGSSWLCLFDSSLCDKSFTLVPYQLLDLGPTRVSTFGCIFCSFDGRTLLQKSCIWHTWSLWQNLSNKTMMWPQPWPYT